MAKDDVIKILTNKRLNRDIIRTLAHEWVHEYQYQKLGVRHTDQVKDIGGPEENMANTLGNKKITYENRN